MCSNIENSFTRFDNRLMTFLYSSDLTITEYKVILFIIRQTSGFHRDNKKLSAGFIAKGTNITPRSVQRAIDSRIRGLRKGAVTILSGLRACGKSSFISQLALEAANQKLCTTIYSGEMSAKNVKKWLTRQAAGKYGVHKVGFDDGSYEYLVKPDHDRSVTEYIFSVLSTNWRIATLFSRRKSPRPEQAERTRSQPRSKSRESSPLHWYKGITPVSDR